MPLNKINWVIIACFLTSLVVWNWGSDLTFEYLAFSGDNLLKGRVWTLVTGLFLHADLVHLLGNMIFLFVFGNTLENELDANKTLTAFFLGGTLSFLLAPFSYGLKTFLVGASAAIFTLTAIVMLVKPLKFSILFLMPQGLVAIIYFVYNVIAVSADVQGNVAHVSHVIGFIIGIPLGIAWSENWVKNLAITIGLLLLYLLIALILIPIIINILM